MFSQNPTPIEAVAQFHYLFKHPVLPTPQIPDAKRCELRIELLAEELKELQAGIKNGNIVECADAFADLQYVLAGAILEFGLANCFSQIFDEVHRSNMSKSCGSEDEARATQKWYLENEKLNGVPVTSHLEERGGRWFVYRDADKKTLKNINYSEANIGAIVSRYAVHAPTEDTAGFDSK